MSDPTKRLGVVEDEPELREALTDYFDGRDGWHAQAFETAEAAALAHASQPFDALLLDLNLPGADGLSLLRSLRADGDRVPVLVVTARGTEDQRVVGLEAGADDYLVKPFSIRELGARLNAVVRRTEDHAERKSPVRARFAGVEVDFSNLEGRGPSGPFRLLAKEAELLTYLLQRRDQVCSRSELLTEVWGFDKAPTTRTVDTHIFQLRQKLERNPKRPQLLVTAHGVGYRLLHDPEDAAD